jgi:DNA/RNA-binding domain of Phe-tRNA-synthetase-like protein
MYFCHSSAIWQAFPQLTASLLLAEDIRSNADVAAQLEPFLARARERLGSVAESDLPEVAAWRRAYAQMGLKPTQYRSAAEALLRRFRREDTLPTLHPLVDLCNAVSLAYALPVAAFDLDGVDGFLEVRRASGTEQYLAFNGEIEHPEPNEVIFADASEQVHARRWTFRQSRRSTIHETTQRALIVSEGLHTTAGTDVPALIATLANELAAAGVRVGGQAILSAQAPRWEIPRS